MGGEGEGLLGGGVVLPMKRRPELAVGWAVGSVVSAKLSCLRERDVCVVREKSYTFTIQTERERVYTMCVSLTGQTCIVTHASIVRACTFN